MADIHRLGLNELNGTTVKLHDRGQRYGDKVYPDAPLSKIQSESLPGVPPEKLRAEFPLGVTM